MAVAAFFYLTKKIVVAAKMKFSLLVFLFNFGIFCYGFNSPRIMNGHPAPTEKYHNVVRLIPYIMALDPNGTEKYPLTGLGSCTGSIISDRHILTAGHCVTLPHGVPAVELRAFFIEYRPIKFDPTQEPIVANFKELGLATTVHFHKGWHWQHFQDDIAIIEFPEGTVLGEPVVLGKNYEEGDKDIGINLGYGDMDITPHVSQHPKTLLEVDLPIFLKKDCLINNVTHPNICAGNSTHRAGQGDSGGPLFFNAANGTQYQIGVAHDGVTKNWESSEQFPDFTTYMRVSAYCDWIEETTNKEAKCVEITKNSPSAEAQNGDENNGAISKNAFEILSTLLFSFILNIALVL